MNREEVEALLEEAYRHYEREGTRTKDPTLALLDFLSFYRTLARDIRPIADDVVGQWVLSEDANRQFDALAIVREFSIVGALPSLRVLADRFEHSNEVGAPFQWAKVNRIIGHLVASESGQKA